MKPEDTLVNGERAKLEDIFAGPLELTVSELACLRHALTELYTRGGWCPKSENRRDFTKRVSEKLGTLKLDRMVTPDGSRLVSVEDHAAIVAELNKSPRDGRQPDKHGCKHGIGSKEPWDNIIGRTVEVNGVERLVSVLICWRCGAWIGLGPASDDSNAVRLEIRLAAWLQDIAILWEPGVERTRHEESRIEWHAESRIEWYAAQVLSQHASERGES